jgi:Bacteriophage HK97-gp10, putative tail-component
MISGSVMGTEQLCRNLEALGRAAQTIGRAALRRGARTIAAGIRRAAPRGETGAVRASIGSSGRPSRGSKKIMAKAGVNVGRKNAGTIVNKGAKFNKKATKSKGLKGGYAPHAHLVAMGTKPRYTKSGAFRGVMPANPFVRVGTANTASAAKAEIRLALERGINKAWAKRNKSGSRY